MTEAELADALSGLSAYDHGALDSGIHDHALLERVRAHLEAMGETGRRVSLARIVRGLFLTDDAIAIGYGLEDVSGFLLWLEDKNL